MTRELSEPLITGEAAVSISTSNFVNPTPPKILNLSYSTSSQPLPFTNSIIRSSMPTSNYLTSAIHSFQPPSSTSILLPNPDTVPPNVLNQSPNTTETSIFHRSDSSFEKFKIKSSSTQDIYIPSGNQNFNILTIFYSNPS